MHWCYCSCTTVASSSLIYAIAASPPAFLQPCPVHMCMKSQELYTNPSKTYADYSVGAGARGRAHITTGTTCQCSMYCNYCDKTHRDRFSLTSYSSNGTYDLANLARVTDDLYSSDTVKRNYATYMNYYCDALYNKREPLSPSAALAEMPCKQHDTCGVNCIHSLSVLAATERCHCQQS